MWCSFGGLPLSRLPSTAGLPQCHDTCFRCAVKRSLLATSAQELVTSKFSGLAIQSQKVRVDVCVYVCVYHQRIVLDESDGTVNDLWPQ